MIGLANKKLCVIKTLWVDVFTLHGRMWPLKQRGGFSIITFVLNKIHPQPLWDPSLNNIITLIILIILDRAAARAHPSGHFSHSSIRAVKKKNKSPPPLNGIYYNSLGVKSWGWFSMLVNTSDRRDRAFPAAASLPVWLVWVLPSSGRDEECKNHCIWLH